MPVHYGTDAEGCDREPNVDHNGAGAGVNCSAARKFTADIEPEVAAAIERWARGTLP